MAWAPSYITGAELIEFARLPEDVDLDVAEEAAAAASRAVDGTCGRQFGKTDAPETRRYASRHDRYLGIYTIEIDDLQNITGLVVTAVSSVLDVTAQTGLMPANAILKGRPYTELQVPGLGLYDVTATSWGWTAFPPAVVLATKLQGSRFLARRDSPYGIAGSPNDGTETRLLARVDPDVEVTLKRGKYVRQWWAR